MNRKEMKEKYMQMIVLREKAKEHEEEEEEDAGEDKEEGHVAALNSQDGPLPPIVESLVPTTPACPSLAPGQ